MKISINRNLTASWTPGANFELGNEVGNNETNYWIGTFVASELKRSISGYNLVLSKTIRINDLDLENDLNLGPGVEIGHHGLVRFSCLYSLKPTSVIDHPNVINGPDVNITRSALGHLDYKIQFDNSTHIIGETVKFKIIPTNPGLVYSRIKKCTMTSSMSNLKYDIFWSVQSETNNRLRREDSKIEFCKDELINFNILTPFSSKLTQIFEFTAFKFNPDSLVDSNILKCDLELSYNQFQDFNQPQYCKKY